MSETVKQEVKKPTKPLEHIHRYQRKVREPGKSVVYFCTKPDCFHRIEKEFLIGKNTECHECGDVFQLDVYALNQAKPKCVRCRKTKASESIRRADSIIDSLDLPDLPFPAGGEEAVGGETDDED